MKAGATTADTASSTRPAPVQIDSGTLEALKWCGLLLMVLDHLNKYLMAHAWPWAFDLGRLSMPLFGIVLAYNLARPQLGTDTHLRIMKRLGIYGLLAMPFFIAIGGVVTGWWPLNILFTLLVATATAWLADRPGVTSGVAAVCVFLIGGAIVEFWWPAVLFILAARMYFRSGRAASLVLCAVALAALYPINGNGWALGALPLPLLAPRVRIELPRLQGFFYGFYPAHLALIWVVAG